MRPIDADALEKALYHEAFETDTDMQKWDSGCWIRYKMFENAMAKAPTIDAVEVVRCKDCKHRYGEECPMRHVEWVECEEDGYVEMDDIVHDNTQDDGFCSYGEREDGEE